MEFRRRRVFTDGGSAGDLRRIGDHPVARRDRERIGGSMKETTNDGMPTASAALRRKSRWFMAGALVIAAAAFLVITLGGISKNLVYYWTPTDLHAAGDKAYGATIRLGGMVAPHSVQGRNGASGLEFDVKDATGIV